MNDFTKENSTQIIDIEFIIRPFYKGRAIISGQSKSLNISCHVRLNNNELKKHGLKYIQNLCNSITQNMGYQYQNGLIVKNE